MSERQITMTVYAIEARLVDITSFGEPPSSRFFNGKTVIKAQGYGERHEWIAADGDRCWPGDLVTVTVIEDDAVPFVSNVSDAPPIDKRTGAS